MTENDMNRICKNIIITIACYIVIHLLYFFSVNLTGAYNFIWDWMNFYHILLLTCIFSVWAVLLHRDITNVFLISGTVLGIIVGNVAGEISEQKSPINFNNGWIFYTSVLFIFCLVGYLIDVKKELNKKQSVTIAIKVMRFIFISVLALTFTINCTLAKWRLGYQKGGEDGYIEGYNTGFSDAQNNKPMKDNTPYKDGKYSFGELEYKGYVMRWGSGYEAGYEAGKNSVSKNRKE